MFIKTHFLLLLIPFTIIVRVSGSKFKTRRENFYYIKIIYGVRLTKVILIFFHKCTLLVWISQLVVSSDCTFIRFWSSPCSKTTPIIVPKHCKTNIKGSLAVLVPSKSVESCFSWKPKYAFFVVFQRNYRNYGNPKLKKGAEKVWQKLLDLLLQ